MGLMRRPEDLIVNYVLARGLGENYHLPPLLYIDDPRGQGDTLSPHDEHFHSLELCLLSLCCLAESSPQQRKPKVLGYNNNYKYTNTRKLTRLWTILSLLLNMQGFWLLCLFLTKSKQNKSLLSMF